MARILVCFALLTAFPCVAATYKWVDEKGITHYGDTIPPQYVNRGSTELNSKGQIIRKTEPALTPEQLKAQQQEIAKQRELGKEAEERRRHDLALLGTYTTEKDIDLARDRNAQQIDGTIQTARERLAMTEARIKSLSDQMEFYQGKDKAGKRRTAPPELLQDLEQNKKQQAIFAATVAELEKEKQQVAIRFNEDKARFAEIKEGGVGIASANAQSRSDRPTSVAIAINQSTKGVINECIVKWAGASDYANSAYAVSAETLQTSEHVELVLDGRLQTRTGQFAAQRMVCPLTSEGKIDYQGTDIKKALASLGARY
jgi:hypothetical protein